MMDYCLRVEQEPTRLKAKSTFRVLRWSMAVRSTSTVSTTARYLALVHINVGTYRFPQPEHSSTILKCFVTSCAFTPVNYSPYFPCDISMQPCPHDPAHYGTVDKRTHHLRSYTKPRRSGAVQLESGVISSEGTRTKEHEDFHFPMIFWLLTST